MSNKWILFSIAAFLLLGINAPSVKAQVNIAPVALYMDDSETTKRIIVRNSSSEPQEISIDLMFGYPDSDEQGEIIMRTFDEVPGDAPSAKEWVRVYPRHLVLPPQQQQTIRFSARPPAGLPAGEYWVRPAITTSNVVDMATGTEEDISANIEMVKRTILSLNYRRGNVQTGIGMDEPTVSISGNTLQLMAELERKGNAAFLGDAIINIYNSAGEVKLHKQKKIAVYYSQKRKFEVDVRDLSPGDYQIELILDTKDRTSENKSIISAPSVSQTIAFTMEKK